MNTEPISTLHSRYPADGRNFKESYPSWGIKKCKEDKNDNLVDYLSSLT